jgi:hypothetical protein
VGSEIIAGIIGGFIGGAAGTLGAWLTGSDKNVDLALGLLVKPSSLKRQIMRK